MKQTFEIIDDTENTDNDSIFYERHTKTSELTINLKDLIEKVRNICREFRKSPTKYLKLQEFVNNEFENKQLNLILDVKTRWNSLLHMIERFLKLKSCIKLALVAVDSVYFLLDSEWKELQKIYDVLNPIEIVLTGICKEDSNILKAEAGWKLLINNLQKNDSFLAIEIHKHLLIRYKQRRQKDLVCFFSYLQDKNFVNSNLESPFDIDEQKNMILTAECLFRRLFQSDENVNECKAASTSLTNSETTLTNIDFFSLYKKKMQQLERKSLEQLPDKFNFKNEFKYYESTGKRSPALELLYKALLTIKPTSVESERAFSTASIFITKIHSRLAPDTLDALYFIREYFKNENSK